MILIATSFLVFAVHDVMLVHHFFELAVVPWILANVPFSKLPTQEKMLYFASVVHWLPHLHHEWKDWDILLHMVEFSAPLLKSNSKRVGYLAATHKFLLSF